MSRLSIRFHVSSAIVMGLMLIGCNSTTRGQKKKPVTTGYVKARKKPVHSGVVEAKATDIAFDVAFVTHIDADMPEQDVFIEREPGSGEVYRVTKGDNDMNAQLYKTAVALDHDPFDEKAVGPHPMGERLGMTLGQWLKHAGTGTYTYKAGVGHLKLKFGGLVPNGVYTMWHAFIVTPPTVPFGGALDAPLGARDGSESVFTADAEGKAEFVHSFRPGLQLSDTWTTALLAIAYHSDGKTYGGSPGPFGIHTHVPLFVMLPKRAGLE